MLRSTVFSRCMFLARFIWSVRPSEYLHHFSSWTGKQTATTTSRPLWLRFYWTTSWNFQVRLWKGPRGDDLFGKNEDEGLPDDEDVEMDHEKYNTMTKVPNQPIQCSLAPNNSHLERFVTKSAADFLEECKKCDCPYVNHLIANQS